jgi:thiamine pyrophosphokinase
MSTTALTNSEDKNSKTITIYNEQTLKSDQHTDKSQKTGLFISLLHVSSKEILKFKWDLEITKITLQLGRPICARFSKVDVNGDVTF